jgi:WD40 repeat protein/serine/threonine protein kinase
MLPASVFIARGFVSMSDETRSLRSEDQSLDDLLAEYLAAEEAGMPPDRSEFLARHPEHGNDLREFFSNRDQMQRLASPLRPSGSGSNGHGNSLLGKVRYFGDYELLEEIAAGGMGIVYKARQVSLNRLVAVKMILRGTLASEEDIKRFRAEAEAAASLQHPGIVPIHEVGLHDGQHYFSMDLVEGRNLAELIREEQLTPKQAAAYVHTAAEAVHYAHQQGTLHRDLKPSNVLIDKQDRVRITDFGLAKRISDTSDLTLTGQILGTPAYMPPEQACGKRSLIAAPSDVYSLGAILYECLAGRPPFRGESPSATLRQVETLDPVSPRLLNPAVPRDLETICLKCLEKEPHKRYGTAQLLAEDLGRFQRGEPIHARPVGPVSRAWRWCRRKPVVAGLGAVSALASLVALAVLLVSHFLVTSALEDRTQALSELTTANDKLAAEERNVREALAGKTQALGDLEKSNQSLKETVDREQQASYYNHVLVAWREWQAGHVEIAEKHLAECRQDLRSWEWHYIARLCRPTTPVAALERVQGIGDLHDGLAPPGICSSRDGTRLACIIANRSVTVLDGTTGVELFRADNARHDIVCLALSSNGARLAALGAASLTIWDTNTKQVQGQRDNLGGSYNRLEFSADGHLLIASEQSLSAVNREESFRRWSARSMTILDAESMKTLVSLGADTSLPGLCIHDAGGRFATLHERQGKLGQIRNAKTVDLASYEAILAGGEFSSDGTRLATFDINSNVAVWDTATGARVGHWHTRPERIERLRLSPDGSKLVTLSFLSTLKVWDAERGKLIASFRETEVERTSVSTTPIDGNVAPWTFHRFFALSPDGTRLASASGDRKITVWDLASGRQTALRTHTPLCFVAFATGDKQRLLYATQPNRVANARPAAFSAAKLQEWNLLGGDESRLIFRPGAYYHTVAVNDDGTRIASVSKTDGARLYTANVWNLRSGQEELSVRFKNRGFLFDVAFNPDDSLLAVTGSSGVDIVDLATKEIRRPIKKMLGRCHRTTFCRDGKRILVAHNSAGIYDVESGAEIVAFTVGGWCGSAVFNHDESRIATCGQGGTIFIWNAATGEKVLDLSIHERYRDSGRDKNVYCVAFSPDSNRLAAADETGLVSVWNALTGKLLLQWPAHDGRAYSVAYSPDGKRLMTMGDDGELRVWESLIGKEILALSGHADRVYSAAFTRDGSKIVSTSADGTIRIWDGTPLPTDERD